MLYREIRACAFAVALAIGLAGCGGGTSSNGGGGGGGPETAIRGRVTDAATGDGVAGATVAVAGRSVTSGADGSYTLTGATVGDSVLVRVSGGPTYMPGIQVVPVDAGETTEVNVALRAAEKVETIDTTAPNTVTGPRGSLVEIPAGAVVNASGTAVPSAVIRFGTLVTTDSNFAVAFPGQFMGKTSAGATPEPVLVHGLLSVDMTDAAGAPLKLAAGQTARIRFAVDPDPGGVLDHLALDDATGIWVREGTASRVAPGVYETQVSHFSGHGGGSFGGFGSILYNVKDIGGANVAGARILATSTGRMAWGRSDANGNFVYLYPLATTLGFGGRAWKGSLYVGRSYLFDGKINMVITDHSGPAGTMRFHVIGHYSEPLVGATVDVSTPEEPGAYVRKVTTDATGTATLTGIPNGVYLFAIVDYSDSYGSWRAGWGGWRRDDHTIQLNPPL
ncbi:MAG: carboxypeptidase regulatory-like domain-containing protein [Chthonomonadales bacterium]|nr:carboxypeptidase regulatory-like domain-containing protein [Chthonomonadales bacterium]